MSNSFGVARRRFLAALLACPVCAATAKVPDWDYDKAGPQKWPALDPAFIICGTGEQQSPINLHDGIEGELPKLRVSWKSGRFTIGNNRHSIQLDARMEASSRWDRRGLSWFSSIFIPRASTQSMGSERPWKRISFTDKGTDVSWY